MKIIVCVFLFVSAAAAANILGIFPTPSISHQVVFHAMMKDLADRGHKLTVLTTDVIKSLNENSNVTQIDFHDSYEIFRRKLNFAEFKQNKKSAIDFMEMFHDSIHAYVESQLKHPEVKKLISKKSDKVFDVIIYEHLSYLPYLAFAELYDAPVIGITSLDTFGVAHEWNGNVMNPVIHPEFLLPYQHGKMAFFERLESLKYYLTFKFVLDSQQEKKCAKMIQKHFPNSKLSIPELKDKIEFLMTNTDPSMGFIRPLLPNTIQLGFMHIEPPQPLPDGELKAFLDNSKHGVIYMSFGSNVQSKDLSPEVLNIFLKVFAGLKQNILWKFEADNLSNKPKNVMISKWLPQSDLLAHSSIKLFITQGGQQSMEEAIDRTIPMIVIPFIADQDSNAKRMERKGAGQHLELHSLTEQKLITTINEMLKPKYKENIKKLRDLVYDQPMTSRERAVWWTEYVIRHKGAKHLDYPGRHVPFYQKYWLDFIGIAIIFLIIALKVLSLIARKLFLNNKKAKTE